MNIFVELLRPLRSTQRIRRGAPVLLLAVVFAMPAVALAQHAGVAHGAGYGGHGYGGHSYYGHGYYGHGYYGHGYYGGWGPWWYPWAYGAAWYYPGYWWYGAPYYYGYDTYYDWNPGTQAYEVAPAPKGGGQAAAGPPDAVAASTELFAYPMKGQTTAQQSQDRYECHRWAADQTGFDPSQQTSGGVSANDTATKRDEYIRAETACLAGRGYSVR